MGDRDWSSEMPAGMRFDKERRPPKGASLPYSVLEVFDERGSPKHAVRRVVVVFDANAEGFDKVIERASRLGRTPCDNIQQPLEWAATRSGGLYIVLEDLPPLAARQQADADDFWKLFTDAAHGLKELHDLGIVHGSISRDCLRAGTKSRLQIGDAPLGQLSPSTDHAGVHSMPADDIHDLGRAFNDLLGPKQFGNRSRNKVLAAMLDADPAERPRDGTDLLKSIRRAERSWTFARLWKGVRVFFDPDPTPQRSASWWRSWRLATFGVIAVGIASLMWLVFARSADLTAARASLQEANANTEKAESAAKSQKERADNAVAALEADKKGLPPKVADPCADLKAPAEVARAAGNTWTKAAGNRGMTIEHFRDNIEAEKCPRVRDQLKQWLEAASAGSWEIRATSGQYYGSPISGSQYYFAVWIGDKKIDRVQFGEPISFKWSPGQTIKIEIEYFRTGTGWADGYIPYTRKAESYLFRGPLALWNVNNNWAGDSDRNFYMEFSIPNSPGP